MDESTLLRIETDPNYQKLVAERKSFGWTLAIITLIIYYGFIAIVAFAPGVIATRVSGDITVGIILGLAIILGLDPADRHLCHARQQRIRRPDQGDRQRSEDGRKEMIGRVRSGALAGAFSLTAGSAYAAGPIEAGTIQPTDWNAILIFLAFVVVTLGITYWAAQRTRTTKDFYAAGGGITGFQNGLAIAGDYMSAASFLGITALVYTSGYYGLIYSIGFLVGWPFIMFLMAEPLRNLGRFTFADVVSYRLRGDADARDGGDRHAGRGRALPDRADGRRGTADRAPVRPALSLGGRRRRRADDHLRHLRRHDRHHLGADHQGRAPAVRLDADGAAGAGAIRFRLQRADRQGDRGPSGSRQNPDRPARRSPIRSTPSRSAWR